MIIIILAAALAISIVFILLGFAKNSQKDKEIESLKSSEHAYSAVEEGAKNEGETSFKTDGHSIQFNIHADNTAMSVREDISCLNGCDNTNYSKRTPIVLLSATRLSGFNTQEMPFSISSDGTHIIFKSNFSIQYLFGMGTLDKDIERDFTFSGELVEVRYGEVGNAGDGGIFLLKKDGTVGMIARGKSDDFISIDTLDGITGVTSLGVGSSDPKDSPVGGGGDMFAIRRDGSAYNLSSYIEKAFEL